LPYKRCAVIILHQFDVASHPIDRMLQILALVYQFAHLKLPLLQIRHPFLFPSTRLIFQELPIANTLRLRSRGRKTATLEGESTRTAPATTIRNEKQRNTNQRNDHNKMRLHSSQPRRRRARGGAQNDGPSGSSEC